MRNRQRFSLENVQREAGRCPIVGAVSVARSFLVVAWPDNLVATLVKCNRTFNEACYMGDTRMTQKNPITILLAKVVGWSGRCCSGPSPKSSVTIVQSHWAIYAVSPRTLTPRGLLTWKCQASLAFKESDEFRLMSSGRWVLPDARLSLSHSTHLLAYWNFFGSFFWRHSTHLKSAHRYSSESTLFRSALSLNRSLRYHRRILLNAPKSANHANVTCELKRLAM